MGGNQWVWVGGGSPGKDMLVILVGLVIMALGINMMGVECCDGYRRTGITMVVECHDGYRGTR